jgi:hypothetical protein
LAQNSIPAELRAIGAPVVRGQFIGIADDTGASTGNHVHFQVHTNAGSYWGRAVDIIFDEVSINDGRPRVKNEFYDDSKFCTWPEDVCVSSNRHMSRNYKSDPNPPTGGLAGLQNGDVIRSSVLKIDGWAQDAESGLRSIQIVAAYNGAMHNTDPVFTTSPFSLTWDMCQAGVPDGPVSLGLRIFDQQSNLTYSPGLVTITKSYQCLPPQNPNDTNPPAVQLLVNDLAVVGGLPLLVQAQVEDTESGIDRVEFYWHSPDWSDPAWQFIGNGTLSAGKWQATFNPAGKLEGRRGAFYAWLIHRVIRWVMEPGIYFGYHLLSLGVPLNRFNLAMF